MPDKPAAEEQDQQKGKEEKEMPEKKPAVNKPDPVAEREVTQTDRLNKKLLSSLLERMNSSNLLSDRFEDSGNNDEGNSSTDHDEFAP